MDMSRSSRKLDHIKHALQSGQSGDHGFEDVKFVHHSLPDISVSDVNLNTTIGGLSLSSPIIVNAMTGGAAETYRVNQELAIVAKEKGLAMAVGSQMAAIKNPDYAYTYKVVREENPKGVIFANLGSEASIDQARRAIEMIEANALQIHLNVVQELVMPEGDRSFKGALQRIEKIVNQLACPVVVKEVGFGISREAAQQLASIGVKVIDIGGFGGTNFASIENRRRDLPFYSFNDWGIKTVPSLIEVTQEAGIDVISSGGIQTPLDIMKSMVLGAKATGMAGFFLKQLHELGLEQLCVLVDSYHDQLKSMMCALGIENIMQTSRVPVVISGESYHWLTQRGIDLSHYAQRDKNKG
jgi:isopentenyl-diphosphate delta-isomerase